jgi:hypothetical protein
LDRRLAVPGGNVFSNGNKTCIVKHYKGMDDGKYSVIINN